MTCCVDITPTWLRLKRKSPIRTQPILNDAWRKHLATSREPTWAKSVPLYLPTGNPRPSRWRIRTIPKGTNRCGKGLSIYPNQSASVRVRGHHSRRNSHRIWAVVKNWYPKNTLARPQANRSCVKLASIKTPQIAIDFTTGRKWVCFPLKCVSTGRVVVLKSFVKTRLYSSRRASLVSFFVDVTCKYDPRGLGLLTLAFLAMVKLPWSGLEGTVKRFSSIICSTKTRQKMLFFSKQLFVVGEWTCFSWATWPRPANIIFTNWALFSLN